MGRVTSTVVRALVVISLVVLAGSWVAAQDSLAGTWVGQTQIPELGTDQVTLTFTKTKDAFTGTVSDSLGQIAGTTEIKNLAVANNEVTGSFPLSDGATVTIKLKLDGNSLKGSWQHESGGTGELAFERKKQ